MEGALRETRLTTHLDMAYFSLVMSFIEESASAFGMEARDTGRLRLASEEIFTHLAAHQEKKALTVEAEDGLYCVGVKFLFGAGADSPLFTPAEAGHRLGESGEDIASMGLIIASRFADRLYILHEGSRPCGVGLVKEKTYSRTEEPVKDAVPVLPEFRVGKPGKEALQYFVRQVTARYEPELFPPDFFYPAKVADMVAQGRYHLLLASDGGAGVAGGIMWQNRGSRLIEVFGPYVFDQPSRHRMPEALVDGLLMEIAKTETVCLTATYATPELPEGYFEFLGSVDNVKPGGQRESRPFYYRQMKEDPGLSVWAHPDLAPFLREEYGRLFLARDIRVTSGGGGVRPAHAFFSLHFDRASGSAILGLLWDGEDAPAVLEWYVKSLKGEGFLNIYFEMDLAFAQEAELTPLLLGQGFLPRLILPHAGQADIVLLQHRGE